jgi:mannose-6-phosphate isomerase-like protein (cupin superfamily)
MKTILLAVTITATALAADPAGVRYWSASELKNADKKLSGTLNGKPFNGEQLGKLGKNATAMIAHRESEGGAEVHNTMNDIFVVQNGEATLVLGGETPGAKETEPNELRGPSIQGGSERKIRAGDIVFIPAKVPHQLLVKKGEHFTYFVVKVAE